MKPINEANKYSILTSKLTAVLYGNLRYR